MNIIKKLLGIQSPSCTCEINIDEYRKEFSKIVGEPLPGYDKIKDNSNMMHDMIKSINEEHDRMVEAAFNHCGFTRDYVLFHPEEFYHTYNHDTDEEIYYRLGKPLFYIVSDYEYPQDSLQTYSRKVVFVNDF